MNNITMVRVIKERLNYEVRERTQRAKTYDININIWVWILITHVNAGWWCHTLMIPVMGVTDTGRFLGLAGQLVSLSCRLGQRSCLKATKWRSKWDGIPLSTSTRVRGKLHKKAQTQKGKIALNFTPWCLKNWILNFQIIKMFLSFQMIVTKDG